MPILKHPLHYFLTAILFCILYLFNNIRLNHTTWPNSHWVYVIFTLSLNGNVNEQFYENGRWYYEPRPGVLQVWGQSEKVPTQGIGCFKKFGYVFGR